jgi:hypothetical protein
VISFALVPVFALLLQMEITAICSESVVVGIIEVVLGTGESALVFLPRLAALAAHSARPAFHPRIHSSPHSPERTPSPIALITLGVSVIEVARSISSEFLTIVAEPAGPGLSGALLLHLPLTAHTAELLAGRMVKGASSVG